MDASDQEPVVPDPDQLEKLVPPTDQPERYQAIAAMSVNRIIGDDGAIPWHLPSDFRWFKEQTMGGVLVMGRKTYEDHESALPGRLNVVITRQADYRAAEGVAVVHSLEEAVALAHEREPGKEVFVIGGVKFFTEAFEAAQRVYETVVHTTVEGGDAVLPAFDFYDWRTTVLQEHPADARHEHAFTVYRHER